MAVLKAASRPVSRESETGFSESESMKMSASDSPSFGFPRDEALAPGAPPRRARFWLLVPNTSTASSSARSATPLARSRVRDARSFCFFFLLPLPEAPPASPAS